MTNKQAIEILKHDCYVFNPLDFDNTTRINRALDVAVEALEAEIDYKTFAEWVAEEIFSENWEYNKDSFQEIACRKLAKLGLVKTEGDNWLLKESEG